MGAGSIKGGWGSCSFPEKILLLRSLQDSISSSWDYEQMQAMHELNAVHNITLPSKLWTRDRSVPWR